MCESNFWAWPMRTLNKRVLVLENQLQTEQQLKSMTSRHDRLIRPKEHRWLMKNT